MRSGPERDQWVLFEENRDAAVAALRRGECETILPAARTFLDRFTEFLHQHEILEQFGDFPVHRGRGSIPAFFFCVTLLHLPLFRLHRLVDIEGVLFRSPFILRLLGFNACQIAQGFYASNGPDPSLPKRWETSSPRPHPRPCWSLAGTSFPLNSRF